METEPGANRGERVVDWLDAHPDLPHLFAYLSELVHLAGYAPDELVVIPRAEIDRRETAAFTMRLGRGGVGRTSPYPQGVREARRRRLRTGAG